MEIAYKDVGTITYTWLIMAFLIVLPARHKDS
jgi:hypothetical protein